MAFNLVIFVQTLVIFLVIDGLWLGIIARDFYQGQLRIIDNLGPGQPIKFNYFSAVGAYFLMALGFELFVRPQLTFSDNNWTKLLNSFMVGGLFGLVLYGVYDFTNYAIFSRWTELFVFVDILWGVFVYTAVSFIVQWS